MPSHHAPPPDFETHTCEPGHQDPVRCLACRVQHNESVLEAGRQRVRRISDAWRAASTDPERRPGPGRRPRQAG